MMMIVWFILGFNAIFLLVSIVVYFLKREKFQRTELEDFCSELPTDEKLPDPFTLDDGKWVERKPLN